MQAELPFSPPPPASIEEPGGRLPPLTAEQRRAIAMDEGDLLLDASAGSGKTSVLVERFARAVVADGVQAGAILAITFTEKAAAELRDRIRARLRSLGAAEQARATEGAFISTIHGFCAHVLRAHALPAGIDPEFAVLDEPDARAVALVAFEDALAELAAGPDGTDLIASYRPDQLRGATLGSYAELRSRGEREPRLPPFPTSCEDGHARRTYGLFDRLLHRFGTLYEQFKRDRSGLDFSDLELIARDLFAWQPDLRERYARRFERIMVDELQDVNAVQLELIGAIARGNLFAVGDAQQSIYGFRHADVELFERLGERLEREGRRMTLETNFRARPEILEVINRAFSAELGQRFRELRAGVAAESREPRPGLPRITSGADGQDTLVELLIVEKSAEWPPGEGLYAPWRVAEARALADRVGALLGAGARPRDVVILTRATTDLRCYERALEDCGVPTYMIGGRGYWAHPQVIDLLAYLRALANPQDEEALYAVLASPLVGASFDALVLLAAAGREVQRDPWSVARGCLEAVQELAPADRQRISDFAIWFERERKLTARVSVEELIERVLERTGYDLYMLRLAGGERRLANVRKLMRLGREHAAAHGPDLRGFLEFARDRAMASGGSAESEAPVEGEALDAIRLMTIHRAKGLEFEVVCVADLGRETPRGRSADVLRVGADGRVGLRVAWPGTGKSVPMLDHKALCQEAQAAEAAEERRLFYVAMTRARERLILSGAAKLEPDGQPAPNGRGAPIGWIARALSHSGVAPVVVRPEQEGPIEAAPQPAARPADPEPAPALSGPVEMPGPETRPLPTLSYSSLSEYQRCGYRFYLQRVLGLPDVAGAQARVAGAQARVAGAQARVAGGEARVAGATIAGATAAERGILAHELLASLDFKRPARPTTEDLAAAALRAGIAPPRDSEIAQLVFAFTESPLAGRLAGADWVKREEQFSFLLEDGPLITGVLDVIAAEPGDRMLVVDYKSDRLEGQEPERVVASAYATQRLVYALAALRTEALEVEVAHVFLERPNEPAVARFSHAELTKLERELEELASGVGRGEFAVAPQPCRAICTGCPAEGGLCRWPLELTRR